MNPIVKLDPSGRVVQSFGAGQVLWPHCIDVDRQGNVWVADARAASAEELKKFPEAARKGHTVTKFSPQGKVLLVLGTPGQAGNPPTHFTDSATKMLPSGATSTSLDGRTFVVRYRDAFYRIEIRNMQGRR